MFFNTPLRAPGSAPKKGEGFLDSLGEARTTVVTGVAMFLVIAATWAAGYVDLPLPGLMMLLAALGLHCGVAVHVARNLDGSTPAADKYDAKKAAQNTKKKRAKKDT